MRGLDEEVTSINKFIIVAFRVILGYLDTKVSSGGQVCCEVKWKRGLDSSNGRTPA